MRTLHDTGLDGLAALEQVIGQTEYGNIEQAAASLTIFSHPDTVRQTGNKAIFPVVRDARRRGDVIELDGRLVGCDDNKSPTDAFLWANGISKRPRDLQFNHIYARSNDLDCYTCLANICASPAFIAKLTDTNSRVTALMKFRSFSLYGWHPFDDPPPDAPEGFGDLIWAPPLDPVECVKTAIKSELERRRDRTTRIVEKAGWLFG